jgi:hypothetical protein
VVGDLARSAQIGVWSTETRAELANRVAKPGDSLLGGRLGIDDMNARKPAGVEQYANTSAHDNIMTR